MQHEVQLPPLSFDGIMDTSEGDADGPVFIHASTSTTLTRTYKILTSHIAWSTCIFIITNNDWLEWDKFLTTASTVEFLPAFHIKPFQQTSYTYLGIPNLGL